MGTWAARRVSAVLATVTMAVLASGCDQVSSALGNAAGTTAPAATSGSAAGGSGTGKVIGGQDIGAPGSALTALNTLTVKPLSTSKTYDRDAFGTPWYDEDHNGCDTRNDVLQRDLVSRVLRSGSKCIVQSGQLTDPYTTKIIRFNRGKDSAVIQIDHIVPLGDAWRTGAYAWTDAQRRALANDPQELLAVDGPTNEAKGDDDAGEWLPPATNFHCQYVARQIGIKARYHLWVTQAEKDGMRRALQTCPSQPELGG